ncbi:MAG: hypothetical protein ABIO85_01680 [Sphingomicrobium sp.]
MAKADRLERLDARRAELEREYRETLLGALRTCAAGSWGLFDHVRDRAARARTAPVIAELADFAEAIDEARARLGLDPFTLHRRFLAERGPVESDKVGEPKQAQAWLNRMAATPADVG